MSAVGLGASRLKLITSMPSKKHIGLRLALKGKLFMCNLIMIMDEVSGSIVNGGDQ